MKISVVIPIYNVEQYVECCLLSVYNQAYKNIEVIIIDDCGSDGSIELAKKISESYKSQFNIYFIDHKVNRGLSAARNTGAAAATGEYIYYLDSDDYIAPDCIENLVTLAIKYPGVNIVQGNVCRDGNKQKVFGDFSMLNYPEYSCDKEWVFNTMVGGGFPHTAWNKLINRQLITEKQLLFKEGIIHEDAYWNWLASAHINSIAFCYTPTYIYRQNDESIMNARYRDRSCISSLMMLEEVFLTPPPCLIANPTILSRIIENAIGFRVLSINSSLLSDYKSYNELYCQVVKTLIRSNNTTLQHKILFTFMLMPKSIIKGVMMMKWKLLSLFTMLSRRQFQQ